MRKLVYAAACSLDGFIAGPGGELDWLQFGPEAQAETGRIWSNVDAVLMGRKTYEFALANAGAGGGDGGGIETFVFARTLKELPKQGAFLVNENAGAFVRDLKGKPGKTIYLMGGGDLARSLFQARVIDEVSLNIHPVLLGGGAALFPDAGHRTELTLTEARSISGGCVLARYVVNETNG